jgi:hypothetical protein
VSCPAAGFCAAVGEYQSQFIKASMTQTWNGLQWAMQPFPVPDNSLGAQLTGVSCTSPTFCEAVGSYLDTTIGLNVPLAATWNGTSWSLQPAPGTDPGSFNSEQFNTVSCASPTVCEAWASGNGISQGITLAEQWNGSSWKLQTVPSGNATVNSVSCSSNRFCEAVGTGVAYTWDGSAWTAQTIPAPAGTGNLGGVSCTSKKFCEATGEYYNGDVVTVAARWNGKAWAAQSPATSTTARMDAVSCASASSCEAGGSFEVDVTSNNLMALAEGWNGSAWQLQHPVAPPGATDNALRGISCASASFCAAVGAHLDSSGNQVNLAETWNGRSWVIQPTPNSTSQFGAFGNSLIDVSCVSAQFCEAVGVGNGATTQMWNGTSWTAQDRPGASAVDPQRVSCVSTSFCMAADGFGHVDTWDGTSWSAGSSGLSGVNSISCLSATFCAEIRGQSSAMWNGTSWTTQATLGQPGASLTAVSCTTPSSCEAVGENVQNGQEVTLAASWNGSAWAIQPTPDPSATLESHLSAVSCTSATSCTAVGWYKSSDDRSFGVTRTLAEVWDGTTWSIRPTPSPSTTDNVFQAVSCGAGQVCTAAGQAQDPGRVPATLIETGD